MGVAELSWHRIFQFGLSDTACRSSPSQVKWHTVDSAISQARSPSPSIWEYGCCQRGCCLWYEEDDSQQAWCTVWFLRHRCRSSCCNSGSKFVLVPCRAQFRSSPREIAWHPHVAWQRSQSQWSWALRLKDSPQVPIICFQVWYLDGCSSFREYGIAHSGILAWSEMPVLLRKENFPGLESSSPQNSVDAAKIYKDYWTCWKHWPVQLASCWLLMILEHYSWLSSTRACWEMAHQYQSLILLSAEACWHVQQPAWISHLASSGCLWGAPYVWW